MGLPHHTRSGTPNTASVSSTAYLVLAVAMLMEWMPRTWLTQLGRAYVRLPSPFQAGVVTAGLLALAAMGQTSTPFIYFQF